MPSALVNALSDSFAPNALLDLYELDTRYIAANGTLFRFHEGVNGLYKPVVYNSIEYTPFPIEVSDMTLDGRGQPSRPKLRCSNIMGIMSQFLRIQDDLVGARFVRRKVYARFLDAVNFTNGANPWGTPDPTAAYDDELFFVSRKVTENQEIVEFECESPFEFEGVQLPNRKLLATLCVFKYRDPETCGYSGAPVMDSFGKLFTAVAPGGYGYTLNARGVWSASNTYAVGDWVTIVSDGDFTNGQTFAYVCSVANTIGTSQNPQFTQTNWVADACPHNLFGCDGHFDSPLPFGGMPGISRSSYFND